MTVLAGVPAVSVVAVAKPGPVTRMGGEPSVVKKLFAAVSAEAVERVVDAALAIAPSSAAFRLIAVWPGVASIWKSFGPAGAELVAERAVSIRSVVEPSGSDRLTVTVSPSAGCVGRSTDIAGGAPAGWRQDRADDRRRDAAEAEPEHAARRRNADSRARHPGGEASGARAEIGQLALGDQGLHACLQS